nr:transposase [Vibrio tasmaniensis]
MEKIIRVGVDLAKNVFHIHAIDDNEKTVWQGKYTRNNWIKAIVKRTPQTAVIGMEACGSAHHWARELRQLGYQVRLVAVQFVKPYVKTNKNDKVDAESSLSFLFRELLQMMYDDLIALDESLNHITEKIKSSLNSNPSALRLMKVTGIGPLVCSTLLIDLGDGLTFKKGRDRLLGISKRGNGYLRKLLVHGARAAFRHVKDKTAPLSLWIKKLSLTKHANVAIIALANKIARISWALFTKKEDYDASLAAA